MIVREMYLNILNKYRDKKLIKVITGIRRSAKSTLLPLYLNQLIESSVKEEQIISINLEDFDYYDLLNTKAIYAYIMERISNGKKSHGKIYIFLDEILQVENFERVVNSLYIQEGINLYVTD